MQVTTEVKTQEYPDKIHPQEKILSIGSCFSEHLGKMLGQAKFDMTNNPFGVVFNPVSIVKILERCINNQMVTTTELKEKSGVFSHQEFHSSYNDIDPHKVVKCINEDLQSINEKLQEVDWLIITLGTSIVYETKEDTSIVANCHKLPADWFQKRMLSTEETVEELTRLIKTTQDKSGAKVIFTVSPIRHIKDGLVDNSRSKARLIESCHQLCKMEGVHYFPSYEILMDELRDYRYYDKDMLHPSELAVEIIMDRFSIQLLDRESQDLLKDIQKLKQSLAHRPFLPHSDSHQAFLISLLEKVDILDKKYPYLSFESEKKKIKNQLVV